jgi:hypothetical protein
MNLTSTDSLQAFREQREDTDPDSASRSGSSTDVIVRQSFAVLRTLVTARYLHVSSDGRRGNRRHGGGECAAADRL